MHNSHELSVSSGKEYTLFNLFLLFYPEPYQKRFGEQMTIVFDDMCREEIEKKGKLGIDFWVLQGIDMSKSIIEQHAIFLKKYGIRKYMQNVLHVNTYNVLGAFLLLPLFTVLIIDIISRIVQRDLSHYNRPVYALMSHTFLYWFPVLFTWVILFPLLAVIINLIPLIQSIFKKRASLFHAIFLKRNSISILMIAAGLGFLAIITLHDFAPCLFFGITRFGILQLPHILSVCRSA